MEIRNLKELKDGSVVFEVSESKGRWTEALNRVSAAMQKQKPIEGCEEGQASLAEAYQEYGQSLIDQASEEFLSGAVNQVCTEHAYFLLTSPEFTVSEANPEQISASVKIIIYPKVPDFNYIGIEVIKPVRKVTEAEIDAAVKQYMDVHPWVQDVERGAQMGDFVEVSFTGTCNGESFPYDHSDQSGFKMGSEILFAGLDEALVGHVAGDDLDLTLTMPENFQRKTVRGKTLDLHVHLKRVCVRVTNVECSDEYVKTHVKGAQTVKEFRELQRIRLQRTNDSKSNQAFDMNLQKALAELVTCPVPDMMVEVSEEEFVRALTKMGMQKGQTLDQTLKARGQTLEQFKKQVHPIAAMRVKASIALDYIMEKEHLEVSKEDVEEKIKSQVQKTGLPHDKALKSLGGEENVTEKLKQEKAYNFVREHCKVVEAEVKRIPTGF